MVDSVKRLLVTDPCPCKSGKLYSECCIEPLKEGWVPELTMYLLCVARDAKHVPTHAVQALKMNGTVTAEEIFSNIKARLTSPVVQRTFEKLIFKEALTPPRDPTKFVVIQGESLCPVVADTSIQADCACCSNSGHHIIEDPPVEEYCTCYWGAQLRQTDGAPPDDRTVPSLKDRVALS
jgi:hypothetical protein